MCLVSERDSKGPDQARADQAPSQQPSPCRDLSISCLAVRGPEALVGRAVCYERCKVAKRGFAVVSAGESEQPPPQAAAPLSAAQAELLKAKMTSLLAKGIRIDESSARWVMRIRQRNESVCSNSCQWRGAALQWEALKARIRAVHRSACPRVLSPREGTIWRNARATSRLQCGWRSWTLRGR